MVRNKETFERWSSKKRPTDAESPRLTKEKRKMTETQRKNWTQSLGADDMQGKGMKVSGNVQPESRDMPNSSPTVHCNDTNIARSGFKNRQREERDSVPSEGQMHDQEFGTMHDKDQRQKGSKSRSGNYQNTCRPEFANQMRGSSERAYEAHVPRRSCTSSSESVERQERGRMGRTSKNTQGGHRRSNSSENDDDKFCEGMEKSSRVEQRSYSVRRHHGSKDRAKRSKRRQSGSSNSDQSGSDNYQCSQERRTAYVGGSSGHPVNLKRDSEGVHRHETDLSDSGTEGSKSPRRRRQSDFRNGSGSSRLQLPPEIPDEGVVEVKSETALRKERRDKQKLRERHVRSREKQGQKAYYLHVNDLGKPYGDGITAWKSDLSKLARGLNPSVMDVREQPNLEMSTLRRRLRQNFEYSQPVDPIFIRQLVGRAVTQYRNTLWKKMEAGSRCPKAFDAEVWKQLERTRSCASHAEKSERMKHANKCRITLGRTGPRGEEGIREMLRLRKGASPDYDDIFTEMQRDKGYGGRAAERKSLKKSSGKVGVPCRPDDLLKSLPHSHDMELKQSMHASTSAANNVEANPIEEDYLRGLQSQIAKLQAEVVARLKGNAVDPKGRGHHRFVEEAGEAADIEGTSLEEEGRTCEGLEDIQEADNDYNSEGNDVGISKAGSAVSAGRRKLRSQRG